MESEQQRKKLYIPYGLNIESEYFTGFGRTELKQCFVGIFAFTVLGAFAMLITGTLTTFVVMIIIGAAGSVMATRKDPNTRISVVGQIGNMVRFSKSQKKYKYVYKSQWF